MMGPEADGQYATKARLREVFVAEVRRRIAAGESAEAASEGATADFAASASADDVISAPTP